jgi:DNA-directed RNA polymerase specialized sigma24 family protein
MPEHAIARTSGPERGLLSPDRMPVPDQIIEAAAAGDEAAWQDLWRAVEPDLRRLVAQPSFLGRISRREDDQRDIVVDVMARLRAGEFYRLKHYLLARRENPALEFLTWLRVVAKRVGIDYIRAHPEYLDQRHKGATGAWVAPVTLPPPSRLPGARPPVTDRGTAQVLMRVAAEGAPPEQLDALARWIQGDSFDDIAAELELGSPAHAARVVRAALERLRRRFRAAS